MEQQGTAGNGKGLVSTKGKSGAAVAGKNAAQAAEELALKEVMGDFGFVDEADLTVQTIATGGVAKWVELSSFMKNPDTSANAICKHEDTTGGLIAGWLVGRLEIPDEKGTETNDDGEKVRFFYSIELVRPCPVTYKDGETSVKEIAKAGDIVNLGERSRLQPLRPLADATAQGARYAVIIRPWDKQKISGGQTMWTFDIRKKEVIPPAVVTGELVRPRTTPF